MPPNPTFVSGANKGLIKARLITYAEQEFILAEAAVKGFIGGTAQTYYNNGVTGAFAEIGITDATGPNYLGHNGVTFDNSTTAASLQQIITQKWLSLRGSYTLRMRSPSMLSITRPRWPIWVGPR
ncbi:MAG: hypothetical protein BGO55_19210 [Sphingobacteriales bacterium 50-39]|nr:SusD/RagB family nutrient-binding outer membrane lipoprotein [Sphingobacteriales bacterium]OJW58849.1 MAG: hypothetical protein BGO55_19210 [Sphingobacteriales bacterium 50-39]